MTFKKIHILSKYWASLIAQVAKNPPAMQETLVWFLGWEDPLEKGQATHSSIFGFLLCLSCWRFCLQCRRPKFDPWVGKICWRRERPPTSVFWPRECHGPYSPWGLKESDTTECFYTGFLGGGGGKESVNAGLTGGVGSIPRWGRSAGRGNGSPFQYSCLENPMDRSLAGRSP